MKANHTTTKERLELETIGTAAETLEEQRNCATTLQQLRAGANDYLSANKLCGVLGECFWCDGRSKS